MELPFQINRNQSNIKNKSGLLLFTLFLLAIVANAQDLPKIKEPQLEAFTIFGDIPASHTTGVPDISIPLFSIETHGYSLPVTLRYHTALVKLPYDYTNVATGWVLEVGGTIVQNVKRKNDFSCLRPDDWKGADYLADAFDLVSGNSQKRTYLARLFSGDFDGEYDIFSCSFPGFNGEFIVDETSPKHFEAVFLSKPWVKGQVDITVNEVGGILSVDDFFIRDEKGYKYTYEKFDPSLYDYPFYMMSKLYSPLGRELFSFDYLPYTQTRASYNYRSYTIPDEWYMYAGVCYLNHPDDLSYHQPDYPIFTSFPTPISPPNDWIGANINKVNFDHGRLDFNLTSNNRYVESIMLKDNDGNTIREVELKTNTFPGAGYRYLDKVIIKDRESKDVSEYVFDYYNKTKALDEATLNLDYWGYLTNGSRSTSDIDIEPTTFEVRWINNWGTITKTQDLTVGTSGTRQPNEAQTKTYVLKTITYPTGGRSEFIYGLNECLRAGNVKELGGLRIEQQINYAQDGQQASVKTYEYDPGIFYFGFDPISVEGVQTTYSTHRHQCDQAGVGVLNSFIRTRSRTITPDLMNSRVSKQVRYNRVTEYTGTIENNIGKETFEYIFPNDHKYSQIDIVSSRRVGDDNMWSFVEEYRGWDAGLLDFKTTFKNTNSGYQILMTEKFNYSKKDIQSYDNTKVFQQGTYDYSVDPYTALYDLYDAYGVRGYDPYIPYDYTVETGASRLTSKVTTRYEGEHEIVSEEIFNYDKGLEKFLTSSLRRNSDRSVYKTYYKYPYDLSSSNTIYQQMEERNIVSLPIKVDRFRSDTFLESTLTNYDIWGNDVIRPTSVEVQRVAEGAWEPVINYLSYDSYGNPTCLQTEDGIMISYIWGYQGQYLLAKLENANCTAISANLIEDIQNASYLDNDNCLKISNCNEESLRIALAQLRSELSEAMVTTYTYDPLVGMTSQTDPNGITTYYEYDEFGRLQFLKDADGNILSKYDYNYAGSQID